MVVQKVIYNPVRPSSCFSVDTNYTFYFSTSAQILRDKNGRKTG
jgi:hypothetical protein